MILIVNRHMIKQPIQLVSTKEKVMNDFKQS